MSHLPIGYGRSRIVSYLLMRPLQQGATELVSDSKEQEFVLFRTHVRMDRYRAQVLILQSLVSIVLSYQVLYTPETILARPVQEILVLGLLSLLAAAFFLPFHLVESRAFTIILLLIDTAITSSIIYTTEQLGSDLYLAYFLIILISALSTEPCSTYGWEVRCFLKAISFGSRFSSSWAWCIA